MGSTKVAVAALVVLLVVSATINIVNFVNANQRRELIISQIFGFAHIAATITDWQLAHSDTPDLTMTGVRLIEIDTIIRATPELMHTLDIMSFWFIGERLLFPPSEVERYASEFANLYDEMPHKLSLLLNEMVAQLTAPNTSNRANTNLSYRQLGLILDEFRANFFDWYWGWGT